MFQSVQRSIDLWALFYFRPHNDRYIVADQATKRMSSFAHALCLYIGPSVRHQAKQIVQKWSEHKMNEKQNSSPYFPPLSGKVECSQCKDTECRYLGKHQRSRRDFTYTSGRCPRLPDQRSFVGEKEQKLYAEPFPIVCTKQSGGVLLAPAV